MSSEYIQDKSSRYKLCTCTYTNFQVYVNHRTFLVMNMLTSFVFKDLGWGVIYKLNFVRFLFLKKGHYSNTEYQQIVQE